MFDELLRGVRSDSMERMRWLVLREFGVLPNSRAARKMGDGDVLFCAMNMLLDRRSVGAGDESNPGFDPARFQRLGGDEV